MATLEKQIEKSFFEDKSIAGVFNLNSFDNNLIAKYNLDISDNKDFFYNITELKDWNLELVNDKMNSFRDKYALNKRNIAEAHLNQYIDNIKNRIYNMELLYDKQIQL
ncbi:MAG: hypothetical protein IJH34_06950 [Romboutsia sp.]|nr:hypothetical protein [Romboutsia sp.]